MTNKLEWDSLIAELNMWKLNKPFTGDDQPSDDVIDNALNYCLIQSKNDFTIPPDSCGPSGLYHLSMDWYTRYDTREVEFIDSDKCIYRRLVGTEIKEIKFTYRSKNYV